LQANSFIPRAIPTDNVVFPIMRKLNGKENSFLDRAIQKVNQN
jgi:hypothetical protein